MTAMLQQQEYVPKYSKEQIKYADPSEFKFSKEYDQYSAHSDPKQDEKDLESIKFLGQKHPITVNSKMIVIDGRRRIKILTKLNRKVKYVVMDFETKEEELLWVIHANTKRRQQTTFEIIEQEKLAIELEDKILKKRQEKGLAPKDAKPKGRLRERIAKNTKLSEKTVERGLNVIKNGSKTQKEKLRDPEKSVKISTISNQIKHKKQVSKLKIFEFPKLKHVNCLNWDPNWKHRNNATGGSHTSGSNQQYFTKEIKKIIKEDVPAVKKMLADNAIVFLWVTTPMFEEQWEVFKALGLEYRTKIYLFKIDPEKLRKKEKFQMGMGAHYRNVVEECIVCTKGKVPPFLVQKPNFIFDDTGLHSEKPDSFYELIEESAQIFDKLVMVDLFGRKKRKNWHVFGNQIIEGKSIKNIVGGFSKK